MTRILIVSARFYEDIASELESGAVSALQEAEVEFDLITVPGAFEIPGAIGFSLPDKNPDKNNGDKRSAYYDGFVALGCVIRGETTHYDYVCAESARGLMDLSVQKNCAIGYGILTVENEDQAWERARVNSGNKGRSAALACLHMIEIRQKLISCQ